MWRHDLSPMQWQQSVICFVECGSACSPRDRLSQPSLTSDITIVCVSLIQESNYSRKQATSAAALYPSLVLQNVMISCTDNEFDFRLMYKPNGLWLIALLWGLLRNKAFRRDILPTSSGSQWECSYIIRRWSVTSEVRREDRMAAVPSKHHTNLETSISITPQYELQWPAKS